MRTFVIIGLVLCLMLASVPAHAKIYKWVDEKGKVHFTDDPTKIPKKPGAKIETIPELPPAVRNKAAEKNTPSVKPGGLLTEQGIPSESNSQGEQNGLPGQLGEKKLQDIHKQLETLQENIRKSQESRAQQFKAINEFEGSQTKPESEISRYPKY